MNVNTASHDDLVEAKLQRLTASERLFELLILQEAVAEIVAMQIAEGRQKGLSESDVLQNKRNVAEVEALKVAWLLTR